MVRLQLSLPRTCTDFGLVVLVNDGPSAGKLAVIAEIIDHNRVGLILSNMFFTNNQNQALIDGPNTSVPRQSIAYRNLILTPYTLATLPRAAGSGAIKKAFEKAGVEAKWEASSWAKKLKAREERKASSDFARFEILLAKKSRRDLVSFTVVDRSVSRCLFFDPEMCWFSTFRSRLASVLGALATESSLIIADRTQVRKAHFKERKAATA